MLIAFHIVEHTFNYQLCIYDLNVQSKLSFVIYSRALLCVFLFNISANRPWDKQSVERISFDFRYFSLFSLMKTLYSTKQEKFIVVYITCKV
jgi:hypothetical protein